MRSRRSGRCAGWAVAGLGIAALSGFPPAAVAEEVPPGVVPIEITARVDNVWEVLVGVAADGSVVEDGGDYSAVARMEYFLTFWNVGSLRSGYGGATISKRYTPDTVYTDVFLATTVPLETQPTVVTQAELTFTGGPSGTFSGTDLDTGGSIVGHVEQGVAGAWTVVFTAGISQTYLVLTLEPFAGWSTCEGGGDSGARFSNISRVVELFPDSDPDSVRSAKPNSVINVCDHVVTGEDSLAKITFADLSTLLMRAESEIVVKSPPREPGRLEVLAGRLRMNIEKVLDGQPIEVKTNLATLGIKGTSFVVDVAPGRETVQVLEGQVEVTSTLDGTVTALGAGEALAMTPGGAPQQSTFDAAAEAAAWEPSGSTDALVPGAEPEDSGSGGISPVVIALIALAVLAGAAVIVVIRRRRR